MSQAPERVQQAIDSLTDGGPCGRQSSLSPSPSGRGDGTGSLRLTLLKRACNETGHYVDDPGTVEQYYFADKDVVVVDLSPGGDGSEQG